METNHNDPVVLEGLQADVQIVANCVAERKPVPPEVARRIREHTAKVRQEILEKHGIQNIGVQIIRELRGELPEP